MKNEKRTIHRRGITSKKKQDILRQYSISESYNEVARVCNVDWKTVKKYVQANTDKLECLTEQKRKQTIEDDREFFNTVIKARKISLERYVQLVEGKKVPANVLITAIGVFTDKLMLRTGEPTEAVRIIWGFDDKNS